MLWEKVKKIPRKSGNQTFEIEIPKNDKKYISTTDESKQQQKWQQQQQQQQQQ